MADPMTSSPLLLDHEGVEDEKGRRSRSVTWVQKVIDVEEVLFRKFKICKIS
ncbi:hypothetical protein CARUB_v10016108mg, partial [Capsella rubella]